MKNLFYIFVFLFTINTTAQKKVIKEIDFNNQTIKIQLQDIDLLEIVHTDEQKISLSMQDYQENPVQLDVKSNDQVIAIAGINITSIEEDFKMDKFCYEQPLFPTYKLMLPKGCNLEIAYKNGDLITHKFNGNLDLRLNTGDVTIGSFKGIIKTELYSGNLDVLIKNTEVEIQSKYGNISTSFSIKNWQKSNISLRGTLGIKKNMLTVQSINANIMLNSSTTQ